jgi:hypothetical protein
MIERDEVAGLFFPSDLYLFALPYVTRWRRVDAPAVRNDWYPRSHLE